MNLHFYFFKEKSKVKPYYLANKFLSFSISLSNLGYNIIYIFVQEKIVPKSKALLIYYISGENNFIIKAIALTKILRLL